MSLRRVLVVALCSTTVTFAGAYRVANVVPGTRVESQSQVLDDLEFVAYRGARYFIDGTELWRTDATLEGTVLVAAFERWIQHLQPAADYLVFTHDRHREATLWRSDGTTAGTMPIAALPGEPAGAAAMDGVVYFAFHDDDGSHLWRTDGTTTGTRLVRSLSDPDQRWFQFFGEVDSRLMLRSGDELWATDGTADGTFVIDRVQSNGLVSWSMHEDAMIYSPYGSTLRRTDGTPDGTYRIFGPETSVEPGISTSQGFFFRASHDLYVTKGGVDDARFLREMEYVPEMWGRARNGAMMGAYDELWTSDGTPGGTRLVRRFARPHEDGIVKPRPVPGPFGGGPDELYFGAMARGDGLELWMTDGTPEGTRFVADIYRGADRSGRSHSIPRDFLEINGSLVFSATHHEVGRELFALDGTQVRLVANRHSDAQESRPRYMVASGPRAYFTTDIWYATTLWATDGTGPGTVPVGRVYPPSSVRDSIMPFDGGVLFAGQAERNNQWDHELCFTEGTNGSELIRDIAPQIRSIPDFELEADGIVYFTADTYRHGRELWSTDGTRRGTRLVVDLNPGMQSSFDASTSQGAEIVMLGSRLLFTRPVGSGDLLQSMTLNDPPLAEGLLWEPNLQIRSLITVGDRVAFIYDRGVWEELWATDGTAQGTALVKAMGSTMLLAFGDDLVFIGGSALHGAEPWRSDLSEQGTRMVADVRPGPEGSLPDGGRYLSLVVAGTWFFAADDGVHGAELWASGGTESGTRLLADINEHGGSFPGDGYALPSGAGIVFTAHDHRRGRELWFSDGTAVGTRLVADVAPGPRSGTRGEFAATGDLLYFAGWDMDGGEELWAVPLLDVVAAAGGKRAVH